MANPVAFSAWLEMDEDGVETVPYMGRTIAHRIWLWLAAFKMAYEAIQDTSTERYTQEYLTPLSGILHPQRRTHRPRLLRVGRMRRRVECLAT